MRSMFAASPCKTCLSPGVRGASHCGRCGTPTRMPAAHKLLLGGSVVLIVAMFVLASLSPDEVEYRPPRPAPASAAQVGSGRPAT
jgi:hypothetical protein